jgi:protein-tyrosine phosphatase
MSEHTPWPHDETLHAWWVVPGRLLAGEYPGAPTHGMAAKKLQLLIDAGIDSIVDLTTPQDSLKPYRGQLRALAQKAGHEVRHFSYPIPDMGVIDQAAYDAILACIGDEIDSGRVVYLHCWGGKGRTSTVVGCLLIDGGLDYDTAISCIAELRAGTCKAADACPESPSQHRLLRERAALRRQS